MHHQRGDDFVEGIGPLPKSKLVKDDTPWLISSQNIGMFELPNKTDKLIEFVNCDANPKVNATRVENHLSNETTIQQDHMTHHCSKTVHFKEHDSSLFQNCAFQ
jgi:hypothetical protein